jgi:hypothetical protein
MFFDIILQVVESSRMKQTSTKLRDEEVEGEETEVEDDEGEGREEGEEEGCQQQKVSCSLKLVVRFHSNVTLSLPVVFLPFPSCPSPLSILILHFKQI